MKKYVLLLTALMTFSTSAHATTDSYADRIQAAINVLAAVAENSNTYQLTPNPDAKVMLKELGYQDGRISSDEEFEDSWLGDSADAWEVDGGAWGTDTLEGAKSYIYGVLEEGLEDMDDAAKIKYVDNKIKLDRAFNFLGSVKALKFGVSPVDGAIQCGIQYPALIILDTKSGKAWTIAMEPSGPC